MREFETTIPLGTVRGLRWGEPGAPRVLALHGWLDNAASFVPLAPLLQGIELVAPDLPGHGRSAHLAPGAEYSYMGAMHEILDIADALGWERFALLGHSRGAGIASLLAAACPERVERLLAIEALGVLTEPVDALVPRMRKAVTAARLLPGKRLRVFPDLDTCVRARMQASGLAAPAARLLVERGVKAVEGGYVWSSDPRLTIPAMARLTDAQADALVRGIECPARVIFASPAQPFFPEPERSRRAALLPRGDLVVIPGGHHLHMEQPGEVATAIGDFLIGGQPAPHP